MPFLGQDTDDFDNPLRRQIGFGMPLPTIQPQQQPVAVPAPLATAPATAALRPSFPPPLATIPTQAAKTLSAPAMAMSPAQAKLQTLEATPAGIDRIHNPWARVPLQILQGIGNAFAPTLTMSLPGTTLNHQLQIKRAADAVSREDKSADAAAQRAHLGADTANLLSETAARNQKPGFVPLKQGEGLFDPNTKTWAVEPTSEDQATEIDPEVAKHLGILPTKDGRYLLPKGGANLLKPPDAKQPTEAETPLTDEEIAAANKRLADRYAVNNPGKAIPSHLQLSRGAKRADLADLEKAMSGTEGAEATAANRAAAAEDRRHNQAVEAENRTQSRDLQGRQTAYKTYQPALDSAERFNVMTKNYEDAVKNHDQQAMLSLLANHLGMTMGIQKGARITRDIIKEAQESRPWLQGLEAKFDKQGYLSGVMLTPQQMRQMVSLGRERFSQDLSKARNESKFVVGSDEGPARTPSKATMHFYRDLAGGDANKAKSMAAQDGWSVE